MLASATERLLCHFVCDGLLVIGHDTRSAFKSLICSSFWIAYAISSISDSTSAILDRSALSLRLSANSRSEFVMALSHDVRLQNQSKRLTYPKLCAYH